MSAVSPEVGLVGEGASRRSLCHGLGRMVNNLTKPLMIIRDRPVAVDLVQARGTVNRLRGKIPRAIECQEIIAVKKHHFFQRLASLELTKDAFEQGA